MGVKDSDPTTVSKLTIYHLYHTQQSATDTRQWTGIWTLFSQHVVTASKPKSSFIHSKSEVHYRPRELHFPCVRHCWYICNSLGAAYYFIFLYRKFYVVIELSSLVLPDILRTRTDKVRVKLPTVHLAPQIS